MKKLWILGLASALLVLSNVETRASVILDWSAVPQGTLQRESLIPPVYTTGSDFTNVDIRVAGTNGATPFRFGLAGLQTPAVTNTFYAGGNPAHPSSLATVANFVPSGSGTPTVTFTIDFFGYKSGVSNVNFTLFNVDAFRHGSVLAQNVVTFNTAGLTLTGSQDNVVSGNTVTGIKNTLPGASDGSFGNVTVHSGSMPLKQIVFTFTQLPQDVALLSGIGMSNISFTVVPEVGQLAIGLAACLVGALWLLKNRREKAGSVA
jgi:parallel beta-helix repeat protein